MVGEKNPKMLQVTDRPDIKSQFNSLLYQLLLDPSERVCFEVILCVLGKLVCFEAILCVLGKFDNADRTEECAGGWYRPTREILKLPEAPSVMDRPNAESKDGVSPKPKKDNKCQKTRRPQPLIKLVLRRFCRSSFFFCFYLFLHQKVPFYV